MSNRPRTWYGYTDMGPIQIPPLPQAFLIQDRGDGTWWLLAYSITPPADDGLGYVSITDVIPSNVHYSVHEAYGEPVLEPGIRLLIRDGYLGYEVIDTNDILYKTRRVLARRGRARSHREIVIPASWTKSGDMLAWQDVEE